MSRHAGVIAKSGRVKGRLEMRRDQRETLLFIYLCNCVFCLNDRQDPLLLDGGRILETEGVDATQDFLLQAHVVKTINFLIPVRFETFFSFLS